LWLTSVLHDDAQEMKPDDRSARRLEYPSTAREKISSTNSLWIRRRFDQRAWRYLPGPVLAFEMQAGNEHMSRHLAPRFWDPLDGFAAEHKPALICGDTRFHNEAVIREAEQRGRATFTSAHGQHQRARRARTRIAAFFAELRETAEQLTTVERWYQARARIFDIFESNAPYNDQHRQSNPRI